MCFVFACYPEAREETLEEEFDQRAWVGLLRKDLESSLEFDFAPDSEPDYRDEQKRFGGGGGGGRGSRRWISSKLIVGHWTLKEARQSQTDLGQLRQREAQLSVC